MKAKLFSKSHTGNKLKKEDNLDNLPEQEKFQLLGVQKRVWNEIKELGNGNASNSICQYAYQKHRSKTEAVIIKKKPTSVVNSNLDMNLLRAAIINRTSK